MNPRVGLAALCAAGCAGAACGSTTTVIQTPTPTPAGPNDRHVDLRDGDGNMVGSATLTSVAGADASASPSASSSAGASAALTTSGVRFHVVITGLAPGSHGFHVYAVGRCDAPTFASAGMHFNPFNKRHGLANRAGPHAGDLPNLPVGADGKATVDIVNSLMTLEGDRDNSLTGPSGSALIVNAKLDDEVSDPVGNSGDRIACGVISASTVAASPSAEATSTPRPTSRSTAKPSPSPSPSPAASPSPSFGHGTGQEGNPSVSPLP